MYYAGIGSRSTPPQILSVMTEVAQYLDNLGWILRSGGAEGADKAFEAGARNPDIYLAEDATEAALKMAAQYHPAWHRCSDYAKKLHARNCMIVLGRDLTNPVKFVVCWTPGGKVTGGTGQALRMAVALKIPVLNMAIQSELDKILKKIKK